MTFRGRTAANPEIEVSSLAREDLARLAKPRNNVAQLTNIRDSHHAVARLFALGLRPAVIAQRTGYSLSRLSVLRSSPAMEELIALYKADVDERFSEAADDFYTLATANMIKAERQLADKLDAADALDETLPTRDLVSISRDAADRFGYGKHTTQTNVNVDFAAEIEKRLNAARASGRVQPKIIPGSATVIPLTDPIRRRI